MKKYFTRRRDILITTLAISVIFLFAILANYQAVNSKNGEKQTESELDVEIVEEYENISEEIESEIEEYIEDDIRDLDIQEEEDDVAEEELFNQAEEEMTVLPLIQRSKNPNELRIGFMTDIHAKSNSGAVRSERIIKSIFKERINYFIEEMNNRYVPDFLLLNGDIIEGTNRDSEVGIGELKSLKKLFNRTRIAKYWVVGNHDLRAVNKQQFMQSLEIDYLDKSFDVGDYRIIILDSNYNENDKNIEPGKHYTRGKVAQKQIKWLERELGTDKRKIVFIHHPPLWDVDVRSNSGLPINSLELQRVFSENSVTAVFAGHIEDLFYDKIDGVKYYVLPGVIKDDKYQGTFAEISIVNDDIELNVSYIGTNGKYRKINIKEIAE